MWPFVKLLYKFEAAVEWFDVMEVSAAAHAGVGGLCCRRH